MQKDMFDVVQNMVKIKVATVILNPLIDKWSLKAYFGQLTPVIIKLKDVKVECSLGLILAL